MNTKEAKKILPKSEFETFEAVIENQISRTSAKRLKECVTLSRKLRNKYRDLGQRQGAQVRYNRTNETDTSLFQRRVQLFDEIIERLTDELNHPRHKAAGS